MAALVFCQGLERTGDCKLLMHRSLICVKICVAKVCVAKVGSREILAIAGSRMLAEAHIGCFVPRRKPIIVLLLMSRREVLLAFLFHFVTCVFFVSWNREMVQLREGLRVHHPR